jgi:hypothetical protein
MNAQLQWIGPGRWMAPVAFPADPDSGCITGQVLAIDGGLA